MISIVMELALAVLGLGAAVLLFFRMPKLPSGQTLPDHLPTVSVIIPARNEARNLPLLLADLRQQRLTPTEIICVDDDSQDDTAQIARGYGSRVLSLTHKPEGWVGKSWACQQGADKATGELLLFLDADVRLSDTGLQRLLGAYLAEPRTITVQPYHRTEKNFEQLSLLFNLVQIAANGTAAPWGEPAGLYGPVILMSKADYLAVGGHASIRSSIVEDMALGCRLHGLGLSFRAFVGDKNISFRMYEGGLTALFEGWTKNLASGATRTAVPIFILVFLAVASLLSVPMHLIAALAAPQWSLAVYYGSLYILWCGGIRLVATKIGCFRLWSALLFPIPLLAFVLIFALSGFKRLFRIKVRWKGRELHQEDTSCK